MARSAMPPCLRAREGDGTTYSGATLRTLWTTAGTWAGDGRRSAWSASSSSPVGIWNSASKKYLRAAVWHLLSDLSSHPPLLLRQVHTPVRLIAGGQISPDACAPVNAYSIALPLSSSHIPPAVSDSQSTMPFLATSSVISFWV